MKIKRALEKFAYETFRPHSRKEYSDLFLRGKGGEAAYPWFWARFLMFSFSAFALVCLGYSLNGWEISVVYFTGGIFADLTFLVLLYELYPKCDVPFALPFLAFFAGGVLSSFFSDAIYAVYRCETPYLQQLWTAFTEETSKAAVTLILLAALKKRNPYFCFLIGAAVGGGYSAFENMGYMDRYYTLSALMPVGIFRAMGTPFSHAAWAALFGWSVSQKGCFKTVRPYLAYAFCFTMHFFVNFPLIPFFAEWRGYPISALTGVITLAAATVVAYRARKELCPAPTEEGFAPTVNGERDLRKRRAFICNVLAACAVTAFSLALLGPTCVYGGTRNYVVRNFGTFAETAAFAQSGYDLRPDFNRQYAEYADVSENYSYTFTDGELTSAVQREQYGEYFYLFTYGYVERKPVNAGEVGETVRLWELRSVTLELGEDTYRAALFADLSRQADEYGRYPRLGLFMINPALLSVYADGDGYACRVSGRTEIRLTESVAYTLVFVSFAAGCAGGYAALKIKSRRERYVE